MNRPDDELILHYYGEHEAPEEIERALAADPSLALRYEALCRELSALDGLAPPSPRPGLESRMWARVRPSLAGRERPSARPLGGFGWAAAASALALVAVGAFLAGRMLERGRTETAVVKTLEGLPPAARERVLKAALVEHLESSQRLLMEVANGNATLDRERISAAHLLSTNGLYRRAAERAGERRVAAVLAELDSLLSELAEDPEPAGMHLTRARAESEDLLFKVRIARNNLKGSS